MEGCPGLGVNVSANPCLLPVDRLGARLAVVVQLGAVAGMKQGPVPGVQILAHVFELALGRLERWKRLSVDDVRDRHVEACLTGPSRLELMEARGDCRGDVDQDVSVHAIAAAPIFEGPDVRRAFAFTFNPLPRRFKKLAERSPRPVFKIKQVASVEVNIECIGRAQS